VQVRLHLPTRAGLEQLPKPSVSKADDHSVERKANASRCQLLIYTRPAPCSSRHAGGAAPNLPLDFVDLLAAFGSAEVHYLIIGGYAVGYHDRPRTTKDLDILLDPAPENIRRACNFADAWVRRVLGVWNGVPVIVMSRDDLIRSKRASGREQDLIDARNLERAGPREP
jgi:hypothetical protein